ncbi:MAG: TonB-dependent receptor [Candidatus Pseudobacter hemicellulosilyticus]|uniref:TonB-dependent receptor n=1 Tax=Candidatus Pseudobacter hemicellulosilyticus TaxID=3121375 RepID=A0AAJ5WPW1_9BACT|nr:MAG: TonB-dependent receptor [Pseudobacter sp.]
MKMLSILLFTASMAVSARPAAQTITLSAKKMPLKAVFQAVEKQTGYFVFGNRAVWDNTQPVTLSVTNMQLDAFLGSVLPGQGLSYRIDGKTISLFFQRITMAEKEAPMIKLFRSITNQTGYQFQFNEEELAHAKPVSINIKEATLEEALQKCFEGQLLTYTIRDKNIVVRQKPLELLHLMAVPPVDVRGKVTDNDGKPLPGANIKIKGSTLGTSTDSLGEFRISVPDENRVLVFSYIGYDSLEVEVKNQRIINAVLRLRPPDMGEVVVVGYGRQKKLTTVGAQSSIVVEDLKQPVANMSNVVAGMVAGVIGVQRSGEPGYDNSEIYIRGISTFTGSSPLVLVDGVERSFNNIDPEDIASFSILKDASATAVYGVRGANGVILIQTKKGKSSKPIINMQVDQGLTEFTRLPKFADGVTYMQISNEAYRNSNPNDTSLRYSLDRIAKTASGSDPELYPNVNWFDEIFNQYGFNQRARVNVNGGSEKAQYYLSLGYYNEKGMFKTDDLTDYNSSMKFNRYNFTSNLTLNVTKKTKVEFGASGWISNGNYPGKSTADIFKAAYVMPPIMIPVRYSDGKLSRPKTADILNPYTLLTQTGYITEFRSQLWSNIRVTQELDFLLKGLSMTGMYSFDNYNAHTIKRIKDPDGFIATERDANGKLVYEQTKIGDSYLSYERTNGGSRQFYLESAINYHREFGKHDVTGMVLYNQSDKVDAFSGDFNSSIPFRYVGIAGRATYAFDSKYLAEANFGYNGSETFTPDKQFGFFPSFGVGWVVSEEQFFEPVSNALSFFKLRFSYGEVGNSNIGGRRFAYIGTVANAGSYSYGRNNTDATIKGKEIGDYAVDVTWEKAGKYNLGFEFKTWRDAISLTVDLFREKRTGIFRSRGDVPRIVGIKNLPYANLGAVDNKGIDATLEINKRVGKDLTLRFRGNFTWTRSKVINDAQAPWPYPWQQRIGRSLGQRFGYIAIGLYGSEKEVETSPYQTGINKPGDIRYKDLNGDGKIDGYDKAPIGYGSMPEIVYGFGPTINYKNWSVSAWFKGISHVDISLSGDGFRPFSLGGERGNLLAEVTNRWTKENPNPNAFYPRITYGNENMNFEQSSWWTKNGAFLRLQVVELNYQLKRDWLKRIGVSYLNLYLTGYNLATISGFKLYDVELGDGRGSEYPLLKTYNFGFRFTF